MTGEKVRDIGFLAWQNHLAKLETMRGKLWKDTLRREHRMWSSLVNQPIIKKRASEFEDLFKSEVKPYLGCEGFTIAGVIKVTISPSDDSVLWRWIWSKKTRPASYVDSDGTHVWYTLPESNDPYSFKLYCETMDGKVKWIKHKVSENFAIKDGLCYFIEVRYPFDTTGILVCDAHTGGHEETIHKEKEVERFLSIIQCANKAVYISSGTWSESKIWLVKGRTIVRKFTDSITQMVLDENNAMVVDPKTHELKACGPKIESWILPDKKHHILSININTGHILTQCDGELNIWMCGAHKYPELIFTILGGEIRPSPYSEIHNEHQQDFYVMSPSCSQPFILHIIGPKIIGKATHTTKPKLPELDVSTYKTKSLDGTNVSYLLVHKKGVKPKKLLGYVYGAYGLSSVVMWPYIHWGPLFVNNWAVAFSYPRGSGDQDYRWMIEGQAKNHIKTIEDFEAVVRDAQRVLKVPPERTAIYGRSAGGLMVGATTARNPDGSLMGATFSEVPFVDAVRSQTNPDIPLVSSGFSEYGNPIKSPINFEALLSISPINSLPADGAPGVFVLCRTGLKDLQVLPFEPVKWIQRLRGESTPPAGKFLSFEEDEAHVYSGKNYYRARAVDLAILDLWADGKLTLPASLID